MDDKKRDIISRSSAIFMKYGLKSVTMDDLARELGISKKTIYIFFADKNALITEIFQLKISLEKCECEGVKVEAGNAIDELFGVSKMVIAKLSTINPAVFLDLKKHHPKVWMLMKEHRWEFVFNSIKKNIERGIAEGIYRENLNVDVITRLNVSMIDMILDGATFPANEYKYDVVFEEMFRFQIHGLANEKGLTYLMLNYNNINNA